LPNPTFAARRLPPAPGRPRRTLDHGIRIRRERTHIGWALHFSGRFADSDTLDCVFDEIERLFSLPEQREREERRPPRTDEGDATSPLCPTRVGSTVIAGNYARRQRTIRSERVFHSILRWSAETLKFGEWT
jgi:hypothetical protein